MQTFHPDATDYKQAAVVEVAEGAEVSNVDITVGRTVEEYAVTGRVLDSSSNAPLPNVTFTFSIVAGGGNRQAIFGLMNPPVVSDGAGQFRIDNVPPGRYMISVSPQSGTDMWGQSQPFDVINQDVTGVEVKATLGANISGVVTLEGNQDPTILAELMSFQVSASVRDGGGGGINLVSQIASAQTVPLNPDGSFALGNIPPGLYWVLPRPNIDSESQAAARLRLPEGVEDRARLRRDGEVAKGNLELKPCQNLSDYQLQLNGSPPRASQ